MLKAHRRFAVRAGTVATIAVAALANAQTPEQEATAPLGGLTAEELAVEPPEDVSSDDISESPLDPADRPIAAADATDVKSRLWPRSAISTSTGGTSST